MAQIISKRHFLNFYGSIIFITLFCGSIELLVGFTLWEGYKNQTLESRDILFVPVSVGLLFIVFFTLPRFLKNTPIIQLDEHKISFFPIFGKVKTYNLQDIQTLKLTGKKPFLPLNDAPLEGAQLIFTKGESEFIYDGMYANSWQMKSQLQNLVFGKEVSEFESEYKLIRLETEPVQFFKGNQFTSFQGIMLWVSTIWYVSIGFPFTDFPSLGRLVICIFFLMAWFLFFSWMIHYFGLSENYLIVRNHTLPWVNRRFYLPNIKEVVFEQAGKRPYSLRVITQDFKSKLYPAGTLRVKHWLSLKSELEKNSIPVRNECVPDPAEPLY